MSEVERLIRYCKVDTQSDPDNENVTPSSEKQFDLAKMLKQELEELGLEDVTLDEHCYVYAWLPSNVEGAAKTVGFIAHMDTAPDFSGTNVNPRIIENYDGNDIVLNEAMVTKVEDFPELKALKGKTLLVSDGTTLLGADDKAGIVSIMEALVYLKNHPEIKHGRIAIGFTPDEEIGNGAKYFDIEKFGADFAYTMDGGTVREISDETFNAASATVTFNGFSIHPGSAKNKMVNAGSIACSYQQLLPEYARPEHTEGRDGFIHLCGMQGSTTHAELNYIIRDHDRNKLEEMKGWMLKAVDFVNAMHGEGTCSIEIKDAYHNMKEVLDEHPDAVKYAFQAYDELSITPLHEPVRGGTDGAELSLRGLSCPNLGVGGGNFHGPYEYCCIEELQQAVTVILTIVQDVAKGE